MSDTFQYLIKIKPLTKYFFSGERYYDDNDGVFYFERSREYPQQTTILGMLRYQLLLHYELLEVGAKGFVVSDTVNAEKLIGARSFNASATTRFGCIESLSPVFIIDELDNHWLACAKAINMSTNENDLASNYQTFDATFLQGGKLNLGNEFEEGVFQFNTYHAKKGKEKGLLHLPGKDFRRHSDVFCEKTRNDEQIGIYKAYRENWVVQEASDRGFYKYQYSRLNDTYSFALYIQTSEEFPESTSIVRMGKEKMPFELRITKQEAPEYLQSNPQTILPGDQILLLSDAYLAGDWHSCCKAAVVDPISFRNNQYVVTEQTVNYDDKPNVSKHLNLLEKGSILWASDNAAKANQLQTFFDNQLAFKKIGYNYFTILKNQ